MDDRREPADGEPRVGVSAVGDATLPEFPVPALPGRDGADSPGSPYGPERVRPQVMVCCTLADLVGRAPAPGEPPAAADGRRAVVVDTGAGRWIPDDRRPETVWHPAGVFDEASSPAEPRGPMAVLPLPDRLEERL
ncbi:MarR family transcriptional regulator [Streptomyces sp. NBC_00344]|uniref:MarR family transcriptional regulator n=1 Tax=Streptomyces sp. NBC_00344 TaxID=2975720 RepID=UPI002E22FF42